MNLNDELSRTLRERADGVVAPPALGRRALARGKALRRRRRIVAATAPALAAVVVAVGATAVVTGRDRAGPPDPPPAVTPTAFPGPTGVGPTGAGPTGGPVPSNASSTQVTLAETRRPPAGPQPPRPYALQPAQPGGGGSVHFGSRDLALPAGFVVAHLYPARGGVVVVLQSLGGFAVRFAADDGSLRTVPELDGRAVVSPDGTRVVGTASFAGSRMVLLDIATGERLGTVPGDRTPLAFLDGGARVLFLDLGADGADGPRKLGVWDLAGYTTREVPVETDVGDVAVASPDGRTVLIAEEERLLAVDLDGRELWQRPGKYWEGPAIAFSPDGSEVALVEDAGDLTVVRARDGKQVSTATGFAFEAVGVEWVDDERVVLSARDPVDFGYDDKRLICAVDGNGGCEAWELPQAVIPG